MLICERETRIGVVWSGRTGLWGGSTGLGRTRLGPSERIVELLTGSGAGDGQPTVTAVCRLSYFFGSFSDHVRREGPN